MAPPPFWRRSLQSSAVRLPPKHFTIACSIRLPIWAVWSRHSAQILHQFSILLELARKITCLLTSIFVFTPSSSASKHTCRRTKSMVAMTLAVRRSLLTRATSQKNRSSTKRGQSELVACVGVDQNLHLTAQNKILAFCRISRTDHLCACGELLFDARLIEMRELNLRHLGTKILLARIHSGWPRRRRSNPRSSAAPAPSHRDASRGLVHPVGAGLRSDVTRSSGGMREITAALQTALRETPASATRSGDRPAPGMQGPPYHNRLNTDW